MDGPEQLSKLMNAEIVTKYPDTRSNPDEPIDWKNIDFENNQIQGIIKFKRADKDGNVSTMIYTDSETFESKNKKNIMKVEVILLKNLFLVILQ